MLQPSRTKYRKQQRGKMKGTGKDGKTSPLPGALPHPITKSKVKGKTKEVHLIVREKNECKKSI